VLPTILIVDYQGRSNIVWEGGVEGGESVKSQEKKNWFFHFYSSFPWE